MKQKIQVKALIPKSVFRLWPLDIVLSPWPSCQSNLGKQSDEEPLGAKLKWISCKSTKLSGSIETLLPPIKSSSLKHHQYELHPTLHTHLPAVLDDWVKCTIRWGNWRELWGKQTLGGFFWFLYSFYTKQCFGSLQVWFHLGFSQQVL